MSILNTFNVIKFERFFYLTSETKFSFVLNKNRYEKLLNYHRMILFIKIWLPRCLKFRLTKNICLAIMEYLLNETKDL